ncbi:hypothetical protein [Pontibacter sp. HSC-36F09]|uniref:hypothetical protein n=1 Tax=Pontibacter sp. HSC-36F09 TaxID=2910966 RepID=UPI00209F9C99|nr:hypothetical protein [Pontibacter sp. HSC-36F09]
MIGTRNNLWMSHVYTPLAAGIITAIYYHAFENVRSKKLVLAGFALLLMVSIFDAFGLEGLEKNNTFARLASNSFIIVLAISYFYKIANDMKTVYLDRDPLFLLSCTILIYYAGTSMASALFNQALEVSHDAARICLSVVFILNILFNAGQGFVLKRMAA